MRSKRGLSLLPIAFIACGREPARRDSTHVGGSEAVASIHAPAAATSAPAFAPAHSGGQLTAPRPEAPPPAAGPPALERRDGIVSVEPSPACSEGTATEGTSAPPGAPTAKGHAEPEIAARGQAIERELENWKQFIAGTGRDERRGAMVLVLHQDFVDYDALRRKLEELSGSIKIVLRPACHSRTDIDRARRALEQRNWHPQAKSVHMGWYFDTRFSGFSVSVDESAPDVASALEHRLGKLVRIRLEKLGPHPNQSRAGRAPHP